MKNLETNKADTIAYIATMIALIILALFISFLITSGLIYLVCWAFGWSWSWKLSIGIWVAIGLISSIFKASNKK